MGDTTSVRDDAVAAVVAAGVAHRDGEPVFDEPWQARAFALAVETVTRLGLPWDAFRHRLIDAVAAAPHRAFYESWLDALESLVIATGAASRDALGGHRWAASSYPVEEDGEDLEVFPLAVDETTPQRLAAILGRHGIDPPSDLVEGRCSSLELVRVVDADRPGRRVVRGHDRDGAAVLEVPVPHSGCWDDLCAELLELRA